MVKGFSLELLPLVRYQQNVRQRNDAIEQATAKLPNWLELQIQNLNCQSFKDLTENIVRHVGNLRLRKEKELYRKNIPRKEDRR